MSRSAPQHQLRSTTSTSRSASATSTRTTGRGIPSPSNVVVHPDVRQALLMGHPVVALESTIVAHGMPYPENWQLSQRVASILRGQNNNHEDAAVVPATIAIRNGIFRVGLTPDELHDLSLSGEQGRATKCSTRELCLVAAKENRKPYSDLNDCSDLAPGVSTASTCWGATTVASTMALAHAAGIATFVTGGIGGVHRNGHVSLDISADLVELSRTPVVVVCAGIKSILDIPRTLEVLETYGVPTVSYQTDEFPAFFSPHSGVSSPAVVDDAYEVARAYWAARDLGLSHGMLVAVPNHHPAGANVEEAIQAALLEADDLHISGQAVTPFVLKRVAETTGGDSLRSNMALVEHNAKVGAEIAMAIADLGKERKEYMHRAISKSSRSYGENDTATRSRSRVVVMGGIVLDVVAKPEAGRQLILGTSNPAICTESDGGVGRNIAEVLGRLGVKPLLYSVVGNDSRGLALLQRLQDECGAQCTSAVRVVDDANTASYVAVLNERGDLHTACADMAVLSQIEPPTVEVLQYADALILDANPQVAVLREAALHATAAGATVFFDPTSVPKARMVTQDPVFLSCVTCAFPNRDELKAMVQCLEGTDTIFFESSTLEEMAFMLLTKLHPEAAQLVITLGEYGVLLASRGRLESSQPPAFEYFAAPKVDVVNATGAGDTLCGACVHAILCNKPISEAVRAGIDAASHSLRSRRTISDDLR